MSHSEVHGLVLWRQAIVYLLVHNPAILIYSHACVLLAHHYYLSAEDQVVWLLSGRLLAGAQHDCALEGEWKCLARSATCWPRVMLRGVLLCFLQTVSIGSREEYW